MRAPKYLLAIALPLLTSAAMADSSGLRDLTVEQTAAAQIAAPHPGALSTSILADRADATYAVGETVRLTLTANQDAYVTVLDIGPTGAVTQLFPNRFQVDNRLRAGRPTEIAGPGTGAKISVGEPTGTELIKVISSNRPFAVIPEGQLQGAGPFRVVAGGVKSMMRDLNVMSETPQSNDTLIAFSNSALYTVPVRSGAGNGEAVVFVPGQLVAAAPALHVNVPADQPFPLLIAADRANYKIGDKPAIAVTPLQACNLTVLEFNAAGVARTLFPSAASPNAAVAAQQTVFVGGVPAADLKLAGPAGVEQVLAICTAGDAKAAGAPLPPANANGTADSVVVQKNLAIVASHPDTAMASVIFTVQP